MKKEDADFHKRVWHFNLPTYHHLSINVGHAEGSPHSRGQVVVTGGGGAKLTLSAKGGCSMSFMTKGL